MRGGVFGESVFFKPQERTMITVSKENSLDAAQRLLGGWETMSQNDLDWCVRTVLVYNFSQDLLFLNNNVQLLMQIQRYHSHTDVLYNDVPVVRMVQYGGQHLHFNQDRINTLVEPILGPPVVPDTYMEVDGVCVHCIEPGIPWEH